MNMTENFTEQKWNTFEASGKIADYLQYKGVNMKNFSDKNVTVSAGGITAANTAEC
jgi:hypothetical protein